jgi:4-diphosphocytidyl-2C-methyl-D-erythritol kinase
LTSIPLQNKLNSFQQEIWQSAGGEGIGVGENDFEEVVFARHRGLKRIKEQLLRFGAKPAAMTGSGSAIFGMFAEARQLERARSLFPNQAVFPISFISRAQYRSAWRRALKLHVEGTLWPPRSRYAPSRPAR